MKRHRVMSAVAFCLLADIICERYGRSEMQHGIAVRIALICASKGYSKQRSNTETWLYERQFPPSLSFAASVTAFYTNILCGDLIVLNVYTLTYSPGLPP